MKCSLGEGHICPSGKLFSHTGTHLSPTQAVYTDVQRGGEAELKIPCASDDLQGVIDNITNFLRDRLAALGEQICKMLLLFY